MFRGALPSGNGIFVPGETCRINLCLCRAIRIVNSSAIREVVLVRSSSMSRFGLILLLKFIVLLFFNSLSGVCAASGGKKCETDSLFL